MYLIALLLKFPITKNLTFRVMKKSKHFIKSYDYTQEQVQENPNYLKVIIQVISLVVSIKKTVYYTELTTLK